MLSCVPLEYGTKVFFRTTSPRMPMIFVSLAHFRENPERTLECPRCFADIPIPTKGVDAFPSHSFVNNLLNILAVQNPTCCTNCEDQAMASARCLDCVENLCPNCVTAHERIRQTKDHKVVCFEELQNNAIYDAMKCPSFCGIHDREVILVR